MINNNISICFLNLLNKDTHEYNEYNDNDVLYLHKVTYSTNINNFICKVIYQINKSNRNDKFIYGNFHIDIIFVP